MADQQQPNQNDNQQGGLRATIVSVVRTLVMWYIVKTVIGMFTGGSSYYGPMHRFVHDANNTDEDQVENATATPSARIDWRWTPDQTFNLYLYVSEDATLFSELSKFYTPQTTLAPSSYEQGFGKKNNLFSEVRKKAQLLWEEHDLVLSDSLEGKLEIPDFPIPASVQNNATMYAYTVLMPEGSTFDTPRDALFYQARLTKHLRFRKEKTRNLMSEVEVPTEENDSETQILNYWKQNITFVIVPQIGGYHPNQLPPPIASKIRYNFLKPIPDKEDLMMQVYPIFYENEFWNLQENMIIVNETVPNAQLNIFFNSLSFTYFTMQTQMEESFSLQKQWGSTDSEVEEFKRMVLETNPYLLGVTMVVTLLHTVFDFLAFKNDISHWKNKKSLQGTSIKSLFLHFGCQVVVFLYLLDHETSWMVLISVGIGLLIEMWKIQKCVIIKKTSGFIPFTFDYRDSYAASETKEYDDMAMRYLSYVLYPLVIGYSIYSLYAETHKSWYSWIISSLYMCVFMFGFIMMTPQLFINYKLKSVAHLPWRAFVYKSLNTFIDDLFAFIIKMPTLHRLSCFRDDLIFLIFLYQKWIYPVDMNRVNEFGQDFGEEEKEKEKAKEKEKQD